MLKISGLDLMPPLRSSRDLGLDPARRQIFSYRSIISNPPHLANARASTPSSVNIGDLSTRPSTYSENHPGGLRPIQESDAVPSELGSQTEHGNARVNSLGYPLHFNPRPRDHQNSFPPRPRRAHNAPSQNDRNQLSETLNGPPGQSQVTDFDVWRRSIRRRQHAQSADGVPPVNQSPLGQGIQPNRRRTRRTEDSGVQQTRRDYLGLSPMESTTTRSLTDSATEAATPQANMSNPTPEIDPDEIRSHFLSSYSQTRRLEIDRETDAEILGERLRANNMSWTDFTLQIGARYGTRTPQDILPVPKGLDDKTDGRPEPKEAEDLKVNLQCRACMSQLVDTTFLPCGHTVLCRWCAEQHMPRRVPGLAKCPVCRNAIAQKVKQLSPNKQIRIANLASSDPHLFLLNTRIYSAIRFQFHV